MISSRRRASSGGIATLLLIAGVGCASRPYEYGLTRWTTPDGKPPESVVVEYGSPGPTIQRLAKVVEFPSKILPFGEKHGRHQLSEETTARLTQYLEENNLTDVRVYVNHYDPGEQWRRLRENEAISPVYRYTFGTASWLGYTLIPNPIFARNKYNPYTNALYLESDHLVDVLYASASAKNVHARRLPGSYLAVTTLPVASLSRHAYAVRDVREYTQERRDWETEQEVYRVLYPRVGSEVASLGGPLATEWWHSPLIRLAGSATGRVVGHAAEKRRERQLGITRDGEANEIEESPDAASGGTAPPDDQLASDPTPGVTRVLLP